MEYSAGSQQVVGGYGEQTLKKAPTPEKRGVAFGRIPKIEGSRSSDRAEGKAFGITLP